MIFLLMGPQGCGKGTQGEKLSSYLDLPLITVGDLLRHVSKDHQRYQEIHELMNKGELAPLELTVELIHDRIAKSDCAKGYILDGWVRNMDNLEYFNPEPDYVIVINLPVEESVKRISGRRTCSTDGRVYNIYTLPKEELEKCTGELIQREDDTEEAVKKRLDIYYTKTIEVINFFKKSRSKVVEVNGFQSPDEVFSELLKKLEYNQ